MVTLPELTGYTAEDLEGVRARSPAFSRYENILSGLDRKIYSLHARRHEAWLKSVAATLTGRAPTESICGYWSQEADEILQTAWREAELHELEATLFALGKQGANELNLSSDIDLLLVAEGAQALEIEKRLRRFQQRLHTPGEAGFCYRLDFDLRPGGKMGPLITTPSQFQDYYWSQGETWERLALVRMRAVTGSTGLAKQIGDLARKFSFRKFLDFTLLEDLKALRAQVHQKGFLRREEELHIKLEVGGIRDIELFVHSMLVLNGGKIPELQTRSTGLALEMLRVRGLLGEEEAVYLRDTYWFYRHLENCVQAIDDRQTHALTEKNLQDLGLPPRTQVEVRMRKVDSIVSSLLGRVDLDAVRLPSDENGQKRWLVELGFSEGVIEASWPQLISATALSHKNARDERARQEFLFAFVNELSRHQTLDRDLGLQLLVDFVRATRAKATFFSMLLRQPRIIEDLARLFCLSPYLGGILSSRPELLDHFILQVDEPWAADMERLLQQMGERKLLTELWSASQFLNDRNLDGLFTRVSSTADEISLQLLTQLKHEYPDSLVRIVALGKWGGRELGLRSDLDFIFVTPRAPVDSDYKVARRFISRLTDPLKGGHLYDVDLRLRPSGQSGPLLVAQDRLTEYWREHAQAWERQAYMRARPLEFKLDPAPLVERGLNAEELEELKRIRLKLLQPGGPDEIDLKHVPGGLIDIEFVAQIALLHAKVAAPTGATGDMIVELFRVNPNWSEKGPRLREIYARMRQFEQMLQLSSAYKTSMFKKEAADFTKAAALLGAEADAAWSELRSLVRESSDMLDGLDPTGHVRSS